MRPKYCVIVRRDGELLTVGHGFVSEHTAAAYAATLPVGTVVVGIARMLSTDMYRVTTGSGVVHRRRPGFSGG